MIIEKIRRIVGNDLLQIYGFSGSGKTTFCYEIAKECSERGMNVLYIDTERNLNLNKADFNYHYIPEFNELTEFFRELPKADVYILDSLGLIAMGEFYDLGMKERANTFLGCSFIAHQLKIATHKYNAIAIVTNQPVSEFARDKDRLEDLPPYGGKSIYYFKEIWKSELISSRKDETVCLIRSWRSRLYGRGKELFRVRIGDKVEIESSI